MLTYAATQPTLITGSGQVQLCWRDKGQRRRERGVTQRVDGGGGGQKKNKKKTDEMKVYLGGTAREGSGSDG